MGSWKKYALYLRRIQLKGEFQPKANPRKETEKSIPVSDIDVKKKKKKRKFKVKQVCGAPPYIGKGKEKMSREPGPSGARGLEPRQHRGGNS